MRKNQKACPANSGYSKEETCPASWRVYLAIELWQENGLTQVKFCSRENLILQFFPLKKTFNGIKRKG
jgi:hypothetical protein